MHRSGTARAQTQKSCELLEAVRSHKRTNSYKGFLPTLIEALERHEHLHISEECRRQLLSIRAATADRLLHYSCPTLSFIQAASASSRACKALSRVAYTMPPSQTIPPLSKARMKE